MRFYCSKSCYRHDRISLRRRIDFQQVIEQILRYRFGKCSSSKGQHIRTVLRCFAHHGDKLHINDMPNNDSVQRHRIPPRQAYGTSALANNVSFYAVSIVTYHCVLGSGHLSDFLWYSHCNPSSRQLDTPFKYFDS